MTAHNRSNAVSADHTYTLTSMGYDDGPKPWVSANVVCRCGWRFVTQGARFAAERECRAEHDKHVQEAINPEGNRE